MMQALHIFRKDIRHLWPECGVYCVILLVFAVAAPLVWPGSSLTNPALAAAIRVLTFLIPLAFFVLIVRVVHEESLVGVNQFWITRPYRWWSLLAAKGLFILICVLLPFVLMQCWLVHHAGLSIDAAASGMMRSILIVSVYALIPYTLVAAITATLTEAFMALACMFIVWLCFLLTVNEGNSMNLSPPHSWAILIVLFVGLLTGILIYQYATRRTHYSRIAFVAAAVLFIFLLWGFSGARFGAPVRAMIRDAYPLSSESSLQLVVLPGLLPDHNRSTDMRVQKDSVEIKLPARLKGLPDGYRIHNPNVSFTLEMQGYRYTSPWQTANLGVDVLSFPMLRTVFDRVGRKDVHLHLELLAEKLQPGISRVVTAAESFNVPGSGRCIFNQGFPVCRYAFHMLSPTRIEAIQGNQACGISTSARPAYATFPVIPDFSRIDPIVQQHVRFDRKICPASQLTFTEYVSAGRLRLQAEIPSIRMAEYQAR